MKIRKAEVMGFCMGVKRAVETAESVAGREDGRRVFTYGPLIHNPVVVNGLQERGVGVLAPGEPLPEPAGVVVIRAHGVAPAVRQMLEAAGWQVTDATCPRVLRSQKIAEAASVRGETVIVVGDRNHGEVRAVAGCARGTVVVQEPADISALRLGSACTVIAQTTIKQEEYDRIVSLLKEKFPDTRFETHQTICPATGERQEALRLLLDECDAIVVIGGRSSANTVRLAHTARLSGKPVWQIESAADVLPEMTAFETVGITAGASTPQRVIDEVTAALERLSAEKRPEELDTSSK